MSLKTLKNYLNYLYRNMKCQIKRHQTVIDIGSGHKPLIRADILCDFFPLETAQRAFAGIFTPPNRFVVGNVLELPFGTKKFDFVYSRALLEHVSDPKKACEEISRIAKRGLLILPSYLWEIMGGSKVHLWLISRKEDKLVFRRKTLKDTELNSQIPEIIRNSECYEKLFNAFYNYFYINLYWTDKIEIEVIDDGQETYTYEEKLPAIKPEDFRNKFKSPKAFSRRLKIFLFETLRKLLGGVEMDLFSVVACPLCKQSFHSKKDNFLLCKHCSLKFPIIDDIPFLTRDCAHKLQ